MEGPQTFRQKDAPRYVPGEITILVCYGISLLDILFIWYWCRRMNAKKALIRAEPGYQKLENQEFLDLTDGVRILSPDDFRFTKGMEG